MQITYICLRVWGNTYVAIWSLPMKLADGVFDTIVGDIPKANIGLSMSKGEDMDW